MKHPMYLKLKTPRTVNPSNDPEGPTLEAPVLKIVKWGGLDETHQYDFVEFFFRYGFVNSKGQFKGLDSTIHHEIVADIVDQIEDNKPTGFGINHATNIKEKSGDWLSGVLHVDADHKLRVHGDFRVEDLYVHLMKKYEIEGELVCVK